MKVQTIALTAAVAMLTACAQNELRMQEDTVNLCYTTPGNPTNKDPANPNEKAKEQKKRPSGKQKCDDDKVLSVIFQNGVPTGVGGGVPDGTGLAKNNKKVEKDKAYCWVATDVNGEPIDKKFAILFSPTDDPKKQKSWVKVKINKNLQTGIEYKYTIWASNKDDNDQTVCGIMDPRFVIN